MMGPAIGGLMVDWLGYAAPFIYGSVTTLATAVFLGFKMTNRKPGVRSAESELEAVADEGKSKRHIPDEYRHLFYALSMNEGIVDEVFPLLDTDHDGYLTHEEYTQRVREFYEDDPQAPGNWILGRF